MGSLVSDDFPFSYHKLVFGSQKYYASALSFQSTGGGGKEGSWLLN